MCDQRMTGGVGLHEVPEAAMIIYAAGRRDDDCFDRSCLRSKMMKPPCIITIYREGTFAIYQTDIRGTAILLRSLAQPVDPENVQVAVLQEDGSYRDTMLDLFQ